MLKKPLTVIPQKNLKLKEEQANHLTMDQPVSISFPIRH